MNILYLGLNNPIKVAVSGCKTADLKVSVTNADIRGERGEFYVRPHSLNKVTISIGCRNKLLRKAEFRVKRVPDPVARIGFIKGGYVSKSALMAQKHLTANLENFDFDYSYKIIQFRMSITVNGFAKEYLSTSNKFTKEQISAIQQVARGQKIYFENINTNATNG